MGITLVLISLLATIIHRYLVIKWFGIPWSVSDSYYLFERKRKGLGALFTGWTYLAAFPLLVAWLDISESYQFLPFLACGSLLFVGTAAQFKESLTDRVHYTSAGICLIAAISWIILHGYWYVPLMTFGFAIGVGARHSKWMYWIEEAAFVATYITLLLMLIF